ncbi:L,D-transpeptidase family protein [uncultured Albimonas sp.]|uniref:L,D-transpeptidase family protein n=1 Tax=uncultured Albimonas sp. TaxID=1331701 RepID=UPI0030EC1215|tara:strand:+ start:176 stop:1030 length:855 start_codon:yes stop_codon:yes gene_type:complete
MVFARSSLSASRHAGAATLSTLPRFASLLILAGGLALAGCAQPQPPSAEDAAALAPTEAAETVAEVAAKQAPETYQALLDSHGVPFQVPATGKAILVNVPSYELIAFEDGEPVLRSRVIVGRDIAGDRTPEMTTETSVVRFRPTWRPTPMMIRRGDYEDKTWPPGRNNPLGLLAIRLEPGMLIYLHGTNRPELFDKQGRALSGGCVRVERWDEVAAWVLDVDVDEVHRLANGDRTFDMDTSGVPVMVRYFTQFPDADGELQAHADIYGQGGSSYGVAMDVAALQ